MAHVESDMPRVTIAIPVFNSAPTLERCVRSAMRQTLQDIEILIADDCSTDDSAAVAERLACLDPRITVIRLPVNAGKPRAMNKLVGAAKGEWIAVLDADDAFHDKRLQLLVAAAEAAGVDLIADNLVYVDAGADQAVQSAFAPGAPPRVITKRDLIAHSNSYAGFDFGILKPVVRRAFLQKHGIAYHEQTRLSEDFYYLMEFFVAGGKGLLVSDPLYFWTMPFGAISREWTQTGSGAWRYDYRQVLQANQHFIAKLSREGQADLVAMLEARSRQCSVMIHYLDAQRVAADGAWLKSLRTIIAHPSTWRLLLRRIVGRVRRRFRSVTLPAAPLSTPPSLRAPGLASAESRG